MGSCRPQEEDQIPESVSCIHASHNTGLGTGVAGNTGEELRQSSQRDLNRFISSVNFGNLHNISVSCKIEIFFTLQGCYED